MNIPTQSGTSSKGSKRKTPMVDVFERQVEVINLGINGVAEAIKEGNRIAEKGLVIVEKQIAIVERARLRVYSDDEIYDELMKIGVPEHLQLETFLFLLKHPTHKRAFFGVPSEHRLELLYKLMYGQNDS